MEGMGWLQQFFDIDGGEELKKLYEASQAWVERDSY